jgi:hypothetical protein
LERSRLRDVLEGIAASVFEIATRSALAGEESSWFDRFNQPADTRNQSWPSFEDWLELFWGEGFDKVRPL